MIKKGVERIAQSVQAHQPRLTTEVLEEEENEEQGETSSSVASQHVMAAITEDPESSGDRHTHVGDSPQHVIIGTFPAACCNGQFPYNLVV